MEEPPLFGWLSGGGGNVGRNCCRLDGTFLGGFGSWLLGRFGVSGFSRGGSGRLFLSLF